MNTRFLLKQKGFVCVLATILMVTLGTLSISYAQQANPTITASVEKPLTETNLHESVVTLTLSGGRFTDTERDIRAAVSVSGIDGVTVARFFGLDRVSDTVVTIELEFASNIDTDATLTFTVGAGAIAGYNGNAITATLPVRAVEESLEASTATPLTETTLHGNMITLTLTGRRFVDDEWDIEDAVSVSGIDGVTISEPWGVRRVSDTVVTVRLAFSGNIDEDATLTLTVGAYAIAGYNETSIEFPVPAVKESLEASTETPLTEALLNRITLTLNGRRFVGRWDIEDAVSVSGIDGVTVDDVERVSDTVAIVALRFSGNIDTDATLTLTIGAEAIIGSYDKAFTFQFPVTAIEESLEASTETPLTEALLNGGIITLTLNGRRFAGRSNIESALSVSGIDGVTVDDVARETDTVATIELEFAGNMDTDATLTLTVGAEAIGYDKAFTFQFPVTAIEESLEASTEFPLTETTLDGSIITLTLIGHPFAGSSSAIRDAVSVSGIDGVTIKRWDMERVNDIEIAVPLEFDGTDFDTDATLTFTVGASIANHNQDLTAQVPVTAIQNSNATVRISPTSVVCPDVGTKLTFSLNIEGGENVAGYQATVRFTSSALSLVDITSGDYLPANPFFLLDSTYFREVTLIANTLAGAANGDGTLATLTVEVEDFNPSTLTLSKVYLVDADGKRWEVATESAEVTLPPEPANAILEDINRDGVVNIQDLVIVSARFGQRGQNSADINGDHLVDIVDLVLVASAVNEAAAAPPLNPQAFKLLTAGNVQSWLSQARQLGLTDPIYLRGITVLAQLLKTLTPKKTALLPNYPNPFNPETWIPYHLSNDVDVQIGIYDTKGALVRRLDLGHQTTGYYTDRTKAAYWDGKNEFGEPVASGLYFYTLTAGDFFTTRKMVIRK